MRSSRGDASFHQEGAGRLLCPSAARSKADGKSAGVLPPATPRKLKPCRNGKPARQGSGAGRRKRKLESRSMRQAQTSEYCRVIVRIREKTHQAVMRLLSASGQDNLSALVEDLLAGWLESHEAKRPASSRKKTKE